MRHTSYDPGSQPRRRRAVFILSVFTLLLSLMMPMITLNASDAAAKAAAAQDCEEGLVFDEQSGECVEEQPECSEGQVFDPNSGQCVDQQPECEEGQVFDSNLGYCVSECRSKSSTALPDSMHITPLSVTCKVSALPMTPPCN
jgi:hypothetical protein